MTPKYSIKLLKMNLKYHKERLKHITKQLKIAKKNSTNFTKIFEKEFLFHTKIANDLIVSIKYLSNGIKNGAEI